MENQKVRELIEQAILSCNSKHCMRILEAIWRQPGIRQRDLAKILCMEASNLQRTLKRIMSSEIPLLYTAILEGKTKGLWVTEAVAQYFGEEPDEQTAQEKDDILSDWIRLEGTLKWRSQLEALLENDAEALPQEKEELLKLIKRAGERKDDDELRRQMGETLFLKFESYVLQHSDKIAKTLRTWRPMTMDGWESQFRLIDYVFERTIFEQKADAFQTHLRFGLDEEAFEDKKWALSELALQIRREQETPDKEAVYQAVADKTQLANPVGYYIAEKLCGGWDRIGGEDE